MIGALPTSLKVAGTNRPIRSDYRVALLILEAWTDVELQQYEQIQITLECLYENADFKTEEMQEAVDQAIWFLNGGGSVTKPTKSVKPLYDFSQDEQIIFSAVNKVANKEVRALEYMHFWTFLGYFNEIGEGSFSTIVSIRSKKQKGKKLEKWEQEYYRNNKEKIDLERKYTAQEQADLEALNELLGL